MMRGAARAGSAGSCYARSLALCLAMGQLSPCQRTMNSHKKEKTMKELKTLCCSVALCCSLFVSGCGLLDDGRMAAWENVRVKEEETKQKILDLREKELSGTPGEDVPTLTVTTRDSKGQPVQVSMNIIPLLRTMILAMSRNDAYGITTTSTAQPVGQTSESLNATTKVIKEIGSAPASLVFLTGEVINRASEDKMSADEININSNNKTSTPPNITKTDNTINTESTTTTNNRNTTTTNNNTPEKK